MVYLIIAAYSLTFCSCTTTRNYYYETPYPAFSDSSAEITKIVLKNKEIIDCEDKVVKIEKGTDSINYIVVSSFTPGIDYKPVWTEKKIPENDILKIQMEKSEVSDGKTALYIAGGVVAGILIIFGVLALSNETFSHGGN